VVSPLEVLTFDVHGKLCSPLEIAVGSLARLADAPGWV
jgi:hypothetical protein